MRLGSIFVEVVARVGAKNTKKLDVSLYVRTLYNVRITSNLTNFLCPKTGAPG